MRHIIQVHIDKTGGTSLRYALRLVHQPQHRRASELRLLYPEYDIPPSLNGGTFVFSMVRNPFDRQVSGYEYQRMMGYNEVAESGISFSDWIRAIYVDARLPYYHDPRYYKPFWWWLDARVDRVYRFEEYGAAVSDIERRLGRSLDVPHFKKTERRPYREYYDDETRAIVEEFFKDDLERFGYAF